MISLHQLFNATSHTFIFATVVFSSLTCANNFTYNYVEVRLPINPNGIGAAASLQLHPNAHAIFDAESNFNNDWQVKAGVGFHAPINIRSDITGDFKVVSVKNDKFDTTLGRLGTELNLGISMWLLPRVQTGTVLGVMHLDKDITKFNLYARFHATDTFSIGAEWRIKDIEDQSVMISARYPF
ncbi:hypothetical protein [Photobacterium nomapromontoriensis]|uniref:hypothetical protein n=1 Tax=Photobacterium nomapromontoriensis TaxID=2910237 RepID=UPI003D118126